MFDSISGQNVRIMKLSETMKQSFYCFIIRTTVCNWSIAKYVLLLITRVKFSTFFCRTIVIEDSIPTKIDFLGAARHERISALRLQQRSKKLDHFAEFCKLNKLIKRPCFFKCLAVKNCDGSKVIEHFPTKSFWRQISSENKSKQKKNVDNKSRTKNSEGNKKFRSLGTEIVK